MSGRTMSTSSSLTTTSGLSMSSKELCVECQSQPYDLVCTCGDKFDFTCIHKHVERIGLEFEFIQSEVGERLLQTEQIIADNNCNNARTIVENWKQKRLQDINDIADNAIHQIEMREKAYSNIVPHQEQFNSLCQETQRIAHEHLTAIVELQSQILEKSHDIQTLPELFQDDINLDSELKSKLNPKIFNENLTILEHEPDISLSKTNKISSTSNGISEIYGYEPDISLSTTNQNSKIQEYEPIISSSTENTDTLMNTQTNISVSIVNSDENLTTNNELIEESTNKPNLNNPTSESIQNDEFDAGQTAYIERRNPIIIPTSNDRFAATICAHDNQLLYNHYNERYRTSRLILIGNITQSSTQQNINWIAPDRPIGGGDDDWIQDITYSSKLHGYLLINRSRLRLLHDDTLEFEEFYEFPDRSIKRVVCDDTYIYLISATGVTAQNGDEIILLNYDKEEIQCKTFRDLVLSRNHRSAGSVMGEFSDLAINTNGHIIITYRFQRRREVGVCLYNISNDGNDWTFIKQLQLNECWHDNLSYSPRVEWCEKLNVFILIEYITSHLIVIDETGQVNGECRFMHAENRQDSPLNVSISNNNWLCVRYESSINIHRLNNTRL